VQTQSDRDVSRWSTARQCARELAIVSEALGAAAPGLLGARRTSEDPVAMMVVAYERTLRGGVPRAVRAVLEEHRLTLLDVGSMACAA